MSPAEQAQLLNALSPLQSEVVRLRLGLTVGARALPLDPPREGRLHGNASARSTSEVGAQTDTGRRLSQRQPMSLEQVAGTLHLTRTQVRRCELDAFARLRHLTTLAPEPKTAK